MATWWSTEAIPVAATAFIPLVSFPLLQVMPVKAVAQSYAHSTIFLFMGAFVLALAVEKWSLHRRIALTVLSKTGTDGRKLILGFMLAAALLSMWMTNTSTAMMLLPIAASVAAMVAEKSVGVSSADKRRFQVALLLALPTPRPLEACPRLLGHRQTCFGWIRRRNLRQTNRVFRLDADWPSACSGFTSSGLACPYASRFSRRYTGESRSGRGHPRYAH